MVESVIELSECVKGGRMGGRSKGKEWELALAILVEGEGERERKTEEAHCPAVH